MEVIAKKLMLEQLIEHYETHCLPMDNGGHVVCFYNERPDENVRTQYEFPQGTFSIRSLSGRAINWNYDPEESGREVKIDSKAINYWK